jgi:uncharacterized membrane protein YccC
MNFLGFDLTSMPDVVSLLGIAFLFIFWLIVSRKLYGLLLVLVGALTINLLLHSDHSLPQMIGVLALGAFLTGCMVALYGLLSTRSLRRRYPMRQPVMPRPVERLTTEVHTPKPVRQASSRRQGRYVVNKGKTRAAGGLR